MLGFLESAVASQNRYKYRYRRIYLMLPVKILRVFNSGDRLNVLEQVEVLHADIFGNEVTLLAASEFVYDKNKVKISDSSLFRDWFYNRYGEKR